jgi:hypothetical protein
MLPLSNVLHLFAHELARLSGRGFPFSLVFFRSLNCLLLWHCCLPKMRIVPAAFCCMARETITTDGLPLLSVVQMDRVVRENRAADATDATRDHLLRSRYRR